MLTLKWTRRTLRDMRHLRDYNAARNPEAARRMVSRLRELVSRLVQTPHMGRPGRVVGTRELSIVGTPYIMAYLIAGKELQIVAVIHSSRPWPNRFGHDGQS